RVTMPWPENWIVFLIALWPAQLLAIVLHEAGHMLAAWCVGIRVPAWGIGIRKVRLRVPIGSTVLYVGRPMSMGLTVCLGEPLELRRSGEMVMFLGGPLATLAGLAGGVALWRSGIKSDVLVAWIAISLLLSLTSTVPFVISNGAVSFKSDAMRLLEL